MTLSSPQRPVPGEPRAGRVVCAWCRTIIQDGPEAPVSHGLCVACARGNGFTPVYDLLALPPEFLDRLPYGAISLDAEGVIRTYNTAEEELAGRTRDRTIGRNFFTDVAPCTDVQEFAGRYRDMVARHRAACEEIRFGFAFPGGTVQVRIVIYYSPEQRRGILLIEKTGESAAA